MQPIDALEQPILEQPLVEDVAARRMRIVEERLDMLERAVRMQRVRGLLYWLVLIAVLAAYSMARVLHS